MSAGVGLNSAVSAGFRFKASRSSLSAAEVAALRRVSPYSISEIQRRAASGESLLDIPVFSGEWPESKPKVVSLLQGIENGSLPLAVYSVEVAGTSHEAEEHLSVEEVRQRLQFLREIWLQQDMQAQLKEGHISSPDEYRPLPENEAWPSIEWTPCAGLRVSTVKSSGRPNKGTR